MAKILTGIVVSIKSDKTAVVAFQRRKKHPIYDKRFLVTKKFQVHDEKNEAGLGDTVEIVEAKPISKTKSWKLLKIVEKAK